MCTSLSMCISLNLYYTSTSYTSVILIVHVTIQGFLEKAMAKVSASLEAEAAALAGCKIEIMVRVSCIEYP